MSALKVTNLERRFGSRTVLEDVNFELPAASKLVVLGPNGAGKSTLLRCIATLLRPHSGSIEALSLNLPDQNHQLRPQIGYIGHTPMLYRHLTVNENLKLAAKLLQVDPAQIDHLLDATQLSSVANEPIRELSRGTVQRVALCRALLNSPKLLLLDEPEANLDPTGVKLLNELLAAKRATTVSTSHNIDAALSESDFTLGLKDGKQQLFAPSDTVSKEAVQELYG